MHKLEFTLKQHTPIIHFQYFLKDATLRTTELKSALDKFIIGELCDCWSSEKNERLIAVKENEKTKLWLKHAEDPKNPAFDYNVSIMKNGSDSVFIDSEKLKSKAYGFFGNQMSQSDEKEKSKLKIAKIESNLIKLRFTSIHTTLLDKINVLLGKFFLLKNFGTRQSKGFGSFYPIEKYNELNTQSFLPFYFDYNGEEMNYTDYNKEKTIELFETINLFYNTLRSGINLKNKSGSTTFYFKSMMWNYAKSKSEHWDKKSIKNVFLSKRQKDEITKHSIDKSDYNNFPLSFNDGNSIEKERYLWRDLLGLSSNENANGWVLSKTNGDFNRFKSPLIFKPILIAANKYRIFFGVDPQIKNQFLQNVKQKGNSEILEAEFKVQYKDRGGLKLSYPSEFDYYEFLHISITAYNSSWVEENYKHTNEFKVLDAIYTHLKKHISLIDNNKINE